MPLVSEEIQIRESLSFNERMRRIRRWRLFAGLQRFDVAGATGIPMSKLAAAENGRARLSAAQESLVTSFIRARLRVVADLEGWRPTEMPGEILGASIEL